MFKESLVTIEIFKSIDKEEHLHANLELLYLIKGEVDINVESNKYTMKKSDIFIINSNSTHRFKTSKDAVLICFYISYIELCDIIENDSVIFYCNSITDENNDYIKLKEKINELLDCFFKKEKKLAMISLEYELIKELVEHFIVSEDEISTNSKKKKHFDRIDNIKNYIDSNYKDQITLNDIADKEFLSVPYLSKFIKEQLGQTLTEYLKSIRLNCAVKDIINTNAPITRIALDNGFATTFIFNKYFKETYQMTPNEYRKKFKIINKSEDKNILEAKEEVEEYLSENRLQKSLNTISIDEVRVKIDIDNKEIINKHYNKIINIGYANDILQSLLQEHIRMLRQEIKFEYARFWGIFNEDMNIENEKSEYNFYKVDKILDFIINNQMKPFIDLMPKAKKISKNAQEDVSLETKVIKYRSLEEWQRLIHKFIVHCINKYGREEVEKWYFEISRNENMNDSLTDKNENLMYFEIFEIIYNKIKEMVPNAKIGGPGGNFTKSSALEFFRDWKKFKAKPDFITIFIYPYTTLIKNGGKGVQASSEKDYLLNKLKSIKDNIKNSEYLSNEIIISEWNSTVSNRNYTNDSCSKAAYIIKNVLDSINKVNKLGYWMASDISGEYLDTDLLLQGGTGLISKNGMKKPSFYAFSFLERLSENMVQKGDNYIVTKNSNNSFTMICHNYKHFNNSYLLNSEENISLDELDNIYENENKLTISFSIENIQNGRYRVKSFILNEKHGSVLNEWIKLNADNHLDTDEISYLKGISMPKLEIEYIDVYEKVLNYSLELLPHEVRLLTFEVDYK